jgi:hypothetical protein
MYTLESAAVHNDDGMSIGDMLKDSWTHGYVYILSIRMTDGPSSSIANTSHQLIS